MNTNKKWYSKLLIKKAHIFNFHAVKNEELMITCGNDSNLIFWDYKDTP
jgi:hypothetical protein